MHDTDRTAGRLGKKDPVCPCTAENLSQGRWLAGHIPIRSETALTMHLRQAEEERARPAGPAGPAGHTVARKASNRMASGLAVAAARPRHTRSGVYAGLLRGALRRLRGRADGDGRSAGRSDRAVFEEVHSRRSGGGGGNWKAAVLAARVAVAISRHPHSTTARGRSDTVARKASHRVAARLAVAAAYFRYTRSRVLARLLRGTVCRMRGRADGDGSAAGRSDCAVFEEVH